MANGRYTYTLDVENSRALKKLADFAKASDKATQRIVKDAKKTKQSNSEIRKTLLSLKREYDSLQKKATATAKVHKPDRDTLTRLRELKKRISEVRIEHEKGFRAANKHRLALHRSTGGTMGVRSPVGGFRAPALGSGPASVRGFRGNTGRRAGIGRALSGGGGGAGLAGAALTGGVAGIAAAAAGKLLQSIEDLAKATAQYANDAAVAAAETQKMRRALAGVLGSEAPAAFESIKQVVHDFNVPLQDATKGFTRFAASAKASGVGSKDIEKSFRGLIAANKALGGSQEQANGILLAATQVFGKGKVAAEELRGQIGERLPGAVAMFAKSMGLTTAELDKRLEDGTVSVADFVKFTGDLLKDFEGDAKGIAKGPEEAGQRLAVQLDLLQRSVGMMLAPIGAAFQTTFAIIVGAINAGIEALNNFLGLSPEAAVDKAQQTLEARQRGLTAAIKGEGRLVNVGQQGSARRETEAEARVAFEDAQKELAKARKLLGTGTGSIQQGQLVTADDLINNRKGPGKGGSGGGANAAADAARRLAKIQADEARKLARLQISLLDEQFRHRLSLTQQQFTGEKAAQIGILNTYIQQNRQLETRGQKFIEDVKRAQAELDAAEARLAASAGGADAVRAQGGVDAARAKLAGAQARSGAFQAALPNFQNANAAQSTLASTQPFRDTTANLTQQIDLLRQKNRLVMEGFSGPALEAEMRKAELDQLALEKISGINEKKAAGNLLDAEAAEKIRAITEANHAAKEAVDALTEAQRLNSGALQEYISSAQDYLSDVQGRMAEIAGTIEQSISSAVMGLVNGTMTATQAFHNFFKSVGEAFLKMAAQMIAKLIVIKLLKTAIGLFGGGGDELPTDSFAGVNNNVLDSVLPTGEFAKGGIVTGPTNALIGEGGMNEAVVPLPNGRSIPVDMGKGGGAGNVQTNITVNVDQGGQTDTQTTGDNANKLGKAIDSAVKRVIMDERRVGGLLYNGRR